MIGQASGYPTGRAGGIKSGTSPILIILRKLIPFSGMLGAPVISGPLLIALSCHGFHRAAERTLAIIKDPRHSNQRIYPVA
jgi:hypothetical protein